MSKSTVLVAKAIMRMNASMPTAPAVTVRNDREVDVIDVAGLLGPKNAVRVKK